MKNRTIKVDCLTRVEGEGSLYVRIAGDRVTDVKFRIFEPPRFFEAFLRGRSFAEAPDITARICGICPIAYQMSAVHAMENAFGVKVEGQLRALRRLIYCGEWIESHVLHIAMLHAPDFLGYDDAIHMANDYPDVVKLALRLKKAGNSIVSLIGGREIHPINVRVGGFYKVPSPGDLSALLDELKRQRDAASKLIEWVARFDFPDFERDYQFVSLLHPDEYPFNEGRISSNKGLDIELSKFDDRFVEEHVEHSNALHCTLKGGGPYLVGPLARYSLNFDRLSPLCREAAQDAGLTKECRNPFRSIIVRAIETLYAFDEAVSIIERYEMPDRPAVDFTPHAGTGYGCTEAPRGMLYHRYRVDDRGIILDARIVPPTSQNQKTIEEDLWRFVPPRFNLEKDKLTLQCEQAVRNYDPCISCATHFMKLIIERE